MSEHSAESDATWEGAEVDPDAFGAAGYLLRPSAENDALTFPPPTKLGSAPCPECGKFARVIVAGHYAYPDGEWTYTTECKKCGRASS